MQFLPFIIETQGLVFKNFARWGRRTVIKLVLEISLSD